MRRARPLGESLWRCVQATSERTRPTMMNAKTVAGWEQAPAISFVTGTVVRSFPVDFDRWEFAPTNIAAFPVAKLIGSIRRECLDHVVVLGERHLRHILLSYMQSYNEVRTYLSLNKDALARRPFRVLDIFFAVRSWVDAPPVCPD
jgi:hypothetical protein